ncbi:hypothetical protein PMW_146 [Pseudomonas phage phiPMW]|uniref:Tail fiber protein n=1 Tax=Pseudomonas phage phiPMW TaxID=1815582 RepID=A0A1S5R1J5_9CAUD|nr:hypothetical protein FDG97_gp204 [Pseudomonas phage phiPMW]ANA49271.1 hypothetical protein PMW_146 [Pseudomonas phage phiPMW]
MAWYGTGTVAVTLNSVTVTGTGTQFSANVRVGDAFKGPDGRWYEVTNVASATVISISPAYAGTTATTQAYTIAPIQGYVKESADQLRSITNQYGATLALFGNAANITTLRTNIQAAKSGANSDITSITGLTTALAVSQGGTGGNTQAAARTGLGLGTAATSATSVAQVIDAASMNLPSADLTRLAEAVYAARVNFGFYTGGTTTLNIDTLPNGWVGLVSSTASGTKPPLTGTNWWIETQATYTGGSALQTACRYHGAATTGLVTEIAFRIRNQPGTAWSPWTKVLGTDDAVSSNSDVTAGKLLTVGYQGLGANTCPSVADLNLTSNVNGWTWLTSGSLNSPSGYASGSNLFTMAASAAEGFQILSARNTNGRFAVRRRVSSTWGNWIEPYMPWNVVGTVSGTSTNVTGSVIERGSNAQGDYVKFADGTMICWGSYTSGVLGITGALVGGYASAVSTFAFPATFSAVPFLNATPTHLTCFGVINASTTTATQGAVQFLAVTSQSTAIARRCNWVATGRWAA